MQTVDHLVAQLGLGNPPTLITEETRAKTLYRYRCAMCAYLNVMPYTDVAEELITTTIIGLNYAKVPNPP